MSGLHVSCLLSGIGGAGLWFAQINHDGRQRTQAVIGRPIAEIAEQWAAMQPYLLDLGDRALETITATGVRSRS